MRNEKLKTKFSNRIETFYLDPTSGFIRHEVLGGVLNLVRDLNGVAIVTTPSEFRATANKWLATTYLIQARS